MASNNKKKKKKEEDALFKQSEESAKAFEKRYISFTERLIIIGTVSVILIVLSIFVYSKSYSFTEQKSLNYTENGSLDYKVYLKPNDFYEKPYLEKDMIYIANIIKSIDIDFNYRFSVEEKMQLDFTYDVIATLVIADSSEKNTFLTKEYKLIQQKQASVEDINYVLNQNISIDYDYYNNLANKFKSLYGIETTSYLTVYLKINEKVSDTPDVIRLNTDKSMSLQIPLSQKAINIDMDYKTINNSGTILTSAGKTKVDYKFVVLSIILGLAALVGIYKSAKMLLALRVKKNEYDKYIDKLLNEYDRLIVETTTDPRFDNYEIIRINKFQELLDVRDNLKLPIIHYVVTPHQKCYFYIKHDKDIYLHIVKAIDLELKKIK